jgi:hypothetical protein
MRFLFESQVREADLLCYTKADQYSYFPKVKGDEPLRVSAITGEGVREWLQLLTGWVGETGKHALNIDYDQYAAAESALGWVNAHVDVELSVPSSPAHLVGPLLDQLDAQLSAAGATIAHLKLFDQTASSHLKAGIVQNGEEPTVEGDLLAPAERKHDLIINLRALGKPDVLRRVVEEALGEMRGEVNVRIQSFAPAYPKPERRMAAGAVLGQID